MQHPPANRVERTLLSAALDLGVDFDSMNQAETRPEHIDPALKAAGWASLRAAASDAAI